MMDFLLLAVATVLLFFGNRVFNVAVKQRKETDPPSNFGEIENPQMLGLSLILFISGFWMLYTFLQTLV